MLLLIKSDIVFRNKIFNILYLIMQSHESKIYHNSYLNWFTIYIPIYFIPNRRYTGNVNYFEYSSLSQICSSLTMK